MNQFDYTENNNGVCITGWHGDDRIISIPERLNGLPVTKIGSCAFYACKDLARISLPESVCCIDSYAFAECRKLSAVSLPEGVECIGDYAFYNCHELAGIALSWHLKNMGYGAFKNCSHMKTIKLCVKEGAELQIGSLMEDTSHEIEIEMYDEKQQLLTKLIFTEYDYDCILQVEARQFDWVYHGSGNVYRQCITKAGVDFEKYDSLFSSAVREDWPNTAMRIAIGRCAWPYRLSKEHKEAYAAYLIQHKAEVFSWLLAGGQLHAFERIMRLIADAESVKAWTQKARQAQKLDFVSFIMDYDRKHFAKKEKSFEL